MITLPRTCFALLGCALLCACDDEPTSTPRPAVPMSQGFAVLSSDWSSTAISLLDDHANLEADDYIDSGSAETGLVTALSGDVDLPTRSGEVGVLVLIDRLKTDVITRIQLSDGTVLGQVETQTPTDEDSDSAFSSNPQDYVRIDDHTAWVTRSEPNLDPAAPEIDRGDDLLRIEPSTMERTDERIDLTSLHTTGTRTDPDSGADESVEVYARPARMTRIGDTLVVGLGRTAFDYSATGPGMVALIDRDSRVVTGFELEGLKGCTHVSPVPGTTDRVLVGCSGDPNQPRSSEGVAILRIDEQDHATVEQRWMLADHPDAPALSGSFTAIDALHVTIAANAFAPGAADSVFGTLALETGEFTPLLTIPSGQGTFGLPTYDAATQKLLVPDASVDGDQRPTQGVHVLERAAADSDFHETALLKVAEDTGLPARYVYPL